MDKDMYVINQVHFVRYKRYNWNMKFWTACKLIFWATTAIGDVIVLGYLFTGIGR